MNPIEIQEKEDRKALNKIKQFKAAYETEGGKYAVDFILKMCEVDVPTAPNKNMDFSILLAMSEGTRVLYNKINNIINYDNDSE